jgi:hypothetical protein
MLMKTKILALSLASLLAFGSLATSADKDAKKEKKSGSPHFHPDLQVSKLNLRHRRARYFLEGEIKEVKYLYKGGRFYEFAQKKGDRWVLLKRGAIPAMQKNGQTFKVTEALKSKPKKGTKFRLRITPQDKTPGDDQKVITAP